MKRGDLVYSKKHGICVVMAPVAPGDETIVIVAHLERTGTGTAERPRVDFGLLNEDDAVPIEIHPQLEDLRQWLTTGRKP